MVAESVNFQGMLAFYFMLWICVLLYSEDHKNVDNRLIVLHPLVFPNVEFLLMSHFGLYVALGY